MIDAYVGLGGNVGEVAKTLSAALDDLDRLPDTCVSAVSRLYRSPPWGPVAQPAFLNAVAAVRTGLDATVLLAGLLAIERRHGRVRDDQRWGPRTLDLDLLLYGDAQLELAGLSVPHPRMHARAFVLVPLLEIAPGITVPGRGRVGELLAQVDATGVVALPLPHLRR